MAAKSVKRRSKKSSSDSNPTSSTNNSMASLPSPLRSRFWIVPIIITSVLFVFAMILFSVSPNKLSPLVSDADVDLIYGVEVVNEFPHDPEAFTQGLLYAGNDSLFESTGLYGHSSVRRVALRTGKVEAIHNMESAHFGEGMTLLGDMLFQVTWMKDTGFIYHRKNLTRIKRFTSPMPDGWGLATDGNILFGSDGSSTLYHIDPQTMKALEKHVVKYKGQEVHNLNELEYINGEIWANVWQTDCIVRLSSKGSRVLGWIYLPSLREELLQNGNTGIDVLNGIAWDEEQNRLFVTGKLWPKLYEIKVQPLKNPLKDLIPKVCILPRFNFRQH
ncbi:glutaminyl-peptide cyclotransferase-like [Andrographis paniculata]|uniref:glutaminyl-peptide cyclotransferase-like n=1 Tax=Andrographis paniculata TaxID=175694 RepID=UPI0021E90F79|nr:glutaminyl-peptide cyclotransferase-like [Andrographis paniculata]